MCLGHRSKVTVITSPVGQIHQSLHRLWASAPAVPSARCFLPFLCTWLNTRCASGFSSEVTSSWKPSLTTPCTLPAGEISPPRPHRLPSSVMAFAPRVIILCGPSLVPRRSSRPEAVLFGLQFSVEGRSGYACHAHPSAPLAPGTGLHAAVAG